MLRPLSGVQNLDDTLGAVEPHMDPVLGSDRRQYIAFLEDLDSRGLLSWSQTPKIVCSVFFCKEATPSVDGSRCTDDC